MMTLITPLLNIGFEGTSLPVSVRTLIRKSGLGGVTLFTRNFESKRQLKSLTREIRRARREGPLFICVDQEGGRVQRFCEGFIEIPPARDLGRAVVGRGKTGSLKELARRVGHELKGVGINTNFAPVLDVDSSPLSPVIGDRSFGADPTLVGRCGAAVIRGLADAGILACGKHYPGHGATTEDSHETLPRLDVAPAEWRWRELVPFRAAVRAGLKMIMTAHVLYPRLDPKLPATLSRAVLGKLRKDLGFKGLVVSDDLDMKGMSLRWNYAQAVELGLTAGIDMFLICRPAPGSIEELVETFSERAARDRKLALKIKKAVARVNQFRRRNLAKKW